MCECKDCENFKTKKREPQVGDKVVHDSMGAGTLVSDCATHNPEGGSRLPQSNCIVFRIGAGLACEHMFVTTKDQLTVLI